MRGQRVAPPERMKRLIGPPTRTLAIFAFLLNLPWEFAQVPLFAGMPTAQHWTAVQSLSVGPTRRRITAFVAVGVLITVVMERLATGPSAAGPTPSRGVDDVTTEKKWWTGGELNSRHRDFQFFDREGLWATM